MNSSTKGAMTPTDVPIGSPIVDVEEYAKAGKTPPVGARYRIRIDKQKYEVDVASMTGRQLLELAGKSPVQRYRIDQKLRGGETRQVPLDGMVEFTTPGLERFMTLPLDQTEG